MDDSARDPDSLTRDPIETCVSLWDQISDEPYHPVGADEIKPYGDDGVVMTWAAAHALNDVLGAHRLDAETREQPA